MIQLDWNMECSFFSYTYLLHLISTVVHKNTLIIIMRYAKGPNALTFRRLLPLRTQIRHTHTLLNHTCGLQWSVFDGFMITVIVFQVRIWIIFEFRYSFICAERELELCAQLMQHKHTWTSPLQRHLRVTKEYSDMYVNIAVLKARWGGVERWGSMPSGC